MCTTASPCQVGWAELLPAECPCGGSANTCGETVFRVAASNPATLADFASHAALYSDRRYTNECKARAISVWCDLSHCVELLKLPRLKGGFIVALTLPPGAGALKGGTTGHVSWWRCGAFDVLAHVTAENLHDGDQ
jgi:hypothetical protein